MRPARITMVPLVTTTLPLKTTTWRCRSTWPPWSAWIVSGLRPIGPLRMGRDHQNRGQQQGADRADEG